ncbi:unnamed protein product [Arabis nemorensis]|uniref:Uncharacterized protein n=1 Tax=Arabis nemorensis TaxID=586526 RepID=A0A565B6G6_9BRAS|nr:unnamed protein product [Arabis nemorensis]
MKTKRQIEELKRKQYQRKRDSKLVETEARRGSWNAVQSLRPNLKKRAFSQEEEQFIVEMHAKMGNKWAQMAEHLPGRTDI